MSVPIWPPIAGYYAMSLVRDGPLVAVRIWYGPPIVDGEEQDRSPRWCVEIDGETMRDGQLIPIESAWPFCAKRPLHPSTYHYMVAHAAWARAQAPDHPKAAPRRAVDFNRLPMRF